MPNHPSAPELIVRAIITRPGGVLANHARRHRAQRHRAQRHRAQRHRDGGYYALPGGHVDPGESCTAALCRELEEELQAAIEVGELRLVAETVYQDRNQGRTRHEVVLFFDADLKHDLAENEGRIASPEPSKHFCWLPLADLAAVNLLPPVLQSLLTAPRQAGARYVFQDATQTGR